MTPDKNGVFYSMSCVDIDECLKFSKEGVERCEKMQRELFEHGGCGIIQGFSIAKHVHLHNTECLKRLKRLYDELDTLEKQPVARSFIQKIIVQFRIKALEKEIVSNLPEAALQFVALNPKKERVVL